MNLQITSFIGASAAADIALVVDVESDLTPFEPGSAWALLLTGKSKLTDTDEDAKFQLFSGAGITVAGSLATCLLTIPATANLKPENLYFDIRATHLTTGESRIVAGGRWQLKRPSTRLASPSVTIYTVEPFPGYVGGGEMDAFGVAENEDGGEDLTLWNDTQQIMQRVRIIGAPGSEQLIFIPT